MSNRMEPTRTCRQGHSWNAEAGGGAVCPICGGESQSGELSPETELGPFNDLPPAPRLISKVQPLPTVVGYEVIAEIGRGGMGVVYQATQLSLHRTVALKVLATSLRADSEALIRFRAEAETIARMQHPNIVHIYDVMEYDGLLCFAMEYVEGGNLNDHLAQQAMPPARAAEIVRTLARAVQAAHERGIIHRDLKPANILVAADGTLKITDFGLAKRLDQSGSQTRSGYLLGTPHYMAPEQAEGSAKHVGPAIDVYALGAILYEMLTGKPPFRGDSAAHILKQVLFDEAVPPSRLRGEIPSKLEAVCLKCLSKDPTKRYPTARALADELDSFLGEGRDTRPPSVPSRPTQRRSFAWIVIGLALLIGIAGVAFLPTVYDWYVHQDVNPIRDQAIELNWEILASPAKEEAFDRLAFPTRDTGYLASRQGLHKTEDSGKSWQRLPLDAPRRVHVLHFADAKTGWLGTDRLRETRDGGETWNDVPLGTEPLRSVTSLAMRPDAFSIAGGTTADGKLALFRKSSSEAKWGKIELSDDLKPMANWYVSSLTVPNAKVGLATLFQGVDGGGAVLRTSDGGMTWTKVFEDEDDLFHLHLNHDGKGWLAGLRGKLWQTADHGTTFQPYSSPDKDGATPTCVAFDPTGRLGLAPLWKNTVLAKTGDEPWKLHGVPLGYALPHAVVVDAGCAYVLASDGRMARFLKRK